MASTCSLERSSVIYAEMTLQIDLFLTAMRPGPKVAVDQARYLPDVGRIHRPQEQRLVRALL